jgi:hypothetical protein
MKRLLLVVLVLGGCGPTIFLGSLAPDVDMAHAPDMAGAPDLTLPPDLLPIPDADALDADM